MSLFKKIFSKKKNSDSEMDFAASELKKEKGSDFQKDNSNFREFFSGEDSTKDNSNNINTEDINKLLEPVMEALSDITSDECVHNVKFNKDDIKKIHAKYTKTVITKDGKQIYESSTDDNSKLPEFVNELFDNIFNKK